MPEISEKPYNFDRVVRIALSVATLVAVLLLLRHLSDVLIPFAAAIVLAYLINPLVNLFQQKTNNRPLAVAISVGGIGIVGLALLAVFVALTVDQASRFGEDFERLRNDFAASTSVVPASPEAPVTQLDEQQAEQAPVEKTALGWTETVAAWKQFRGDAEDASRAERFARFRSAVSGTYVGEGLEWGIEYSGSEEFRGLIAQTAKRVAVGGVTVAAFLVHTVLGIAGLIIVLLYLIFLLLDFPEFARSWKTFLPPGYRDPIAGFLTEFDVVLRRYLRGQTVVALLTGVLFAIGFSIIGLPMAVPFGLFVGLLNMVPYLQVVGLVPGVLLAVMRSVQGESSLVLSVMLLLVVFGIVQVIQDALITPRVMGKATGLKPIAIMLGVFIWGKLLGFLGLLLAIPLTCLGIAYYRRFVLLDTETAGEEASHRPAARGKET